MRLAITLAVVVVLAFATFCVANISSAAYLSFLGGIGAKGKGFLTLLLIALSVVFIVAARLINNRRHRER